MGQDRDVRIRKAILVERVEDHQAAGVPIVAPVITTRVGQIGLQPGEQRCDRCGVHEVLSSGTIWMATVNSPGKVSKGSSQPGSRALPGYRSTAKDVYQRSP